MTLAALARDSELLGNGLDLEVIIENWPTFK